MRNPLERDIKIAELEPTNFVDERSSYPAEEEEEFIAEEPEADDATPPYGSGVEIDFSNYVFEDTYDQGVPTDSTIAKMPEIADNVDEGGDFKVNKYKLNFSPDIVYANGGYNTFYGFTGSTIMAFSDLLGNHQIVFVSNLQLDLKNSDYGLQYLYLPGRVDFGIAGFHSDKFSRLEFGATWYNISRENLEHADPIQRRTVIVPSLGYTHDTVLWGFTAPVSGTRYNVNVFGTPKLGNNGLSFVNVTGDYRTYLRLGKNYSIALRLAGGGSFGRNPQKFIIGGVDNWINRTFEGGFVPLENAEDYIFLQVGTPLRGYNYNARIGSRYGLFNFELRYPFFAFLQAGPLPIGLQSINGAFFFDMGAAWNKEKDFVAFTRNENGNLVTRDLLMGMGTGARIFFLAFLVRFDVAWAWNIDKFSSPKYYLSLGADF
jgi:hypothetical protein